VRVAALRRHDAEWVDVDVDVDADVDVDVAPSGVSSVGVGLRRRSCASMG